MAGAMSDMMLWGQAGTIGTLTLNRPERHNSLVPALLRDLLTHLEAANEQNVRAIILRATGRSFSTGGDVRAFYERRDEGLAAYAREIVGLLNDVILAMLALPAPIVAAVHGPVTGGSLGFVLASDVVLVAPEAGFTPYYSVVGFSPDGGWTALLPQVVGRKRASEVLTCNITISAEQAVAWGLVNRVVPAERIQAEAQAVADTIAGMQPHSITSTKALLRANLGDVATRLERERQQFVEQIITEEARGGMAAFLGEEDTDERA